MANKVEFGISELVVGTFGSTENGFVLGAPYHQPGAVSFAPEEDSEQNIFYADNIAYYSSYSGGAITGDLEVAKFSDEFKTQFLGYQKASDDGALCKIQNATKPNIYVAFEVDGDSEHRRIILFNGQCGSIVREYNTIEESKEPATETLSIAFSGAGEIMMASYRPTDSGYNTVLVSPTVPILGNAQ